MSSLVFWLVATKRIHFIAFFALRFPYGKNTRSSHVAHMWFTCDHMWISNFSCEFHVLFQFHTFCSHVRLFLHMCPHMWSHVATCGFWSAHVSLCENTCFTCVFMCVTCVTMSPHGALCGPHVCWWFVVWPTWRHMWTHECRCDVVWATCGDLISHVSNMWARKPTCDDMWATGKSIGSHVDC